MSGADGLQDAVANGDTRTLTLHHVHSGETATVTFKRDGRYDAAALQKLNVLLQDWRRKEPTKMDPYLFDIVWEVYRDVDATQAIEVIGGYRSPATNAMLRSRSKGVAQTSLHMQGKAMDFYIPGVSLAKIREAGLRMQRGGVGFYPTSGSPFVHLDTGGIRHWPRMTRDQLARVFPDGKTVHVPADGRPMSNYAVALAEVERRGSRPGGAGAAFASASTGPSLGGGGVKSLFSSLFKGKGATPADEDDDDSAPVAAAAPVAVASAAPVPAVQPAAAVVTPAVSAAASVVAARAVPLPIANPLVAAAPSAPLAAPVAATLVSAAVPLPLARPGVAPAAVAPAVVATLEPANVPLPPVRPGAGSAQLAALDTATLPGTVPLPAARPGAGAGLPALITHGAQTPAAVADAAPGAPAGGYPAMSYASAGDFVVARPAPGRAPEPAAVPLPGRTGPARPPHTAETREEIRRLFGGATVADKAELRTPELRRFAAFVSAPRQVVDGGFGRDASSGLATSHFSGAAVVAVPVVSTASAAPAPQTKRVSMGYAQ
ncbi:MAG TPA: DUF882 domain-containing protein [Xanthobacteraceae bacterium]|nr:DUF882 domain-containing protein [Xanthobacteraceae bacterium]